jgi:hypothetical protein
MNCKECQSILEAYFDRELDQATADAVSLHLEQCAACMEELDLLATEQQAFSAYASEVEVPQELWSGVQARLVSQPDRIEARSWIERLFAVPRISVPATAALVIAAIALTVVLMKVMNAPEKQVAKSQAEPNVSVAIAEPVKETPPAIEPAPEKRIARQPKRTANVQVAAQTTPDKTAEQLVRDAEKKYLAAIQILSRDVGKNQSQIDPDTRMKLDQALASIDRTIAETRKVVKQRPDDPVAAQYLLSAYARKVDALREMAAGNF